MALNICKIQFTRNIPRFTMKDRKVQEQVEHDNIAKAGTTKVQKSLMAGFPELEELRKTADKVYNTVYANTFAWDGQGYRAITAKRLFSLMEYLREANANLEQLKTAAVEAYQNRMYAVYMSNSNPLGLLADSDALSRYPSPSEFANTIGWKLNFEPVADVEMLRRFGTNLFTDDDLKEVEDKQQEKLNTALKEIFGWLHEQVVYFAERTGDITSELKAHDTLVPNLSKMAEIAEDLNFANDPVLSRFVDDVRSIARTAGSTSNLKINEQARIDAHAKARKVLEDMKGYV